MLQQSDIDNSPTRKKFYVVLPQIRNSIQPDTAIERLRFKSKSEFVPLKGIAIMSASFALAYLLLYFGMFDWIFKIFQG